MQARLIGYAPVTQSVTLAAGQVLDVDLVLAPQAIELAELVAVGYGEQTLGNVTGAVTSVTSGEFNTGRVINATTREPIAMARVTVGEAMNSGAPMAWTDGAWTWPTTWDLRFFAI